MLLSNGCDGERRPLTVSDATGLAEAVLGLAGFRVVAVVEAAAEVVIHVETDPERLRPIDADLQVPNTNKFKAVTGWEPTIPFETTMRDLLNYWRGCLATGQRYLTR